MKAGLLYDDLEEIDMKELQVLIEIIVFLYICFAISRIECRLLKKWIKKPMPLLEGVLAVLSLSWFLAGELYLIFTTDPFLIIFMITFVFSVISGTAAAVLSKIRR